MANRLTQIATRTGDDGTTGLGDGTRVPKDHLRVDAMGHVDELNSSLGVLLAEPLPDDVRELLVVIQHELFNLGGELSIPGYELLKAEAVAAAGRGAGPAQRHAAAAEGVHPARRHAQRGAGACQPHHRTPRRTRRGGAVGAEAVNDAPRQYLNRLSDLLFVLARVLNRANLDGLGGDDVYWRSEKLARATTADQ
jgi:cob(I)alamin adenosyltransferase